jgi:hypothetical protein
MTQSSTTTDTLHPDRVSPESIPHGVDNEAAGGEAQTRFKGDYARLLVELAVQEKRNEKGEIDEVPAKWKLKGTLTKVASNTL